MAKKRGMQSVTESIDTPQIVEETPIEEQSVPSVSSQRTPRIQRYDVQGQSWKDVSVPGLEIIEDAKLSPELQRVLDESRKRGPSGMKRSWTMPDSSDVENYGKQLGEFTDGISEDLKMYMESTNYSPEVKRIVSTIIHNPNAAGRMIRDSELSEITDPKYREELRERLFDLKDRVQIYRGNFKQPYDPTYNMWQQYNYGGPKALGSRGEIPRIPVNNGSAEDSRSGMPAVDKLNSGETRIKSSIDFINNLTRDDGTELTPAEKDRAARMVLDAWKRQWKKAWLYDNKKSGLNIPQKMSMPRTKETWDLRRGVVKSTLQELRGKKTPYAYEIFGDYVKNTYGYITLNNLDRNAHPYYNKLLESYEGDYERLRDDVTDMLCGGLDPMDVAGRPIISIQEFKDRWGDYQEGIAQAREAEAAAKRNAAAVARMNAARKKKKENAAAEIPTEDTATADTTAAAQEPAQPTVQTQRRNNAARTENKPVEMDPRVAEALKTENPAESYILSFLKPFEEDTKNAEIWKEISESDDFKQSIEWIKKLLEQVGKVKNGEIDDANEIRSLTSNWNRTNKLIKKMFTDRYGPDLKKYGIPSVTEGFFPMYNQLTKLDDSIWKKKDQEDANADVHISVDESVPEDDTVNLNNESEEDDDDDDFMNNPLFSSRRNDGNEHSEGMPVDEAIAEAAENTPTTVGFVPPDDITNVPDLITVIAKSKMPTDYKKIIRQDLILGDDISMCTVIENWNAIRKDANTPEWLKKVKDPKAIKEWVTKNLRKRT